ncbi:AGAP006185-PA-like protein [Anopheles sinensis]|uniref:AGAP006185-PA-like protein n=1 Tax=Anopheles sinensis TaxID=74873 RepID=A0A084WL45_ANOSI|nr:AGAP006185-PA-like protein [Anopheles sinensis]
MRLSDFQMATVGKNEERPISCDRVCNRAEWPRICRFELVVEKRTFHRDRARYQEDVRDDNITLTAGRKDRLMVELVSDTASVYYTVNGRYVGPTLKVCENDYLVVDVENRIPGESISLHWTGQSQRKTPFMDGVPMITQCPIASYTRFQYKFQADKAGTQLYHGFAGSERTQGLLGALVVRAFPDADLNSTKPDSFLSDNVWLVTELHGRLAVNGRSDWQQTLPSSGNTIREHRVRVLYAGSCTLWLELPGHELRLLALDGNRLDMHEPGPAVDRVLLHDGLRVDLALARLSGDTIVSDYEIRLTPLAEHDAGQCDEPAIFSLHYDFQPRKDRPVELLQSDGIEYNSISPSSSRGEDRHGQNSARVLDLVGGLCLSKAGVVCLQDIPGARDSFPKELHSYDTRLEFTVNTQTVADDGPFGGRHAAEAYHETVHSVNGFTFAFPSALMLMREMANVEGPRAHTCGHRRLPRSCHPMMARCECVHVEHLEAGHRVEMVLINAGKSASDPASPNATFIRSPSRSLTLSFPSALAPADPSHDYVYHLHGHTMFVVGLSTGHRREPGKLARNLQRPPQRDTIVVRRDSIVVVRFVAKSAGLWLLRDIGSPQWSRGLDVVLNVRAHPTDFDIPSDFPACRHFIGPRYFLI